MNLPLSYSKLNVFNFCPIKYYYQYIKKEEIVFEPTYPLILGELTHLFIKLFTENKYTKKSIIDLQNNLEKLNEFFDLYYPSYNNYDDTYSIKRLLLENNNEAKIKFIKDNIIVFYQSIKLMNIFINNFYKKISQSSNTILSEFSFNNIININNDLTVCLYGSIDNLFYNYCDNDIKFLYFGDIKTGKKLYSDYFNQLFFYLYNILNYNIDENEKIKDNNDNFEIIKLIKKYIKEDNIHLILFSLKEEKFEKKLFNNEEENYNLYISKLFNIISKDIFLLHKEKEHLSVIDIFDMYKESFNLENKEDVKKCNAEYFCNQCDYSEKCEYKKIKKG